MSKFSRQLEEAIIPKDGYLSSQTSRIMDEIREEAILEAGGYPVGTKRKRADGVYVKSSDGTWTRVTNTNRTRTTPPNAKEMIGAASAPLPSGRVWVDAVPGLPLDTREAHRSEDGTDYSEERLALHRDIITSFLAEAKEVPSNQKPVALFMMGITASGKSTTRKKVSIAPFLEHGMATVDPDAIKEAIPEYQQALKGSARNAAMMAHEESSDIGDRVGAIALKTRRNVIFDGTGKSIDKMLKKVEQAKAAGYHVLAIMPHVSVDVAKERADSRAEKTGRYVPHAVIDEAGAKVPANFLKLADHFDEFTLFDNDSGDPKPIYQKKHGNQAEVLDDQLFSKFRKAAHQTEALTNQKHTVMYEVERMPEMGKKKVGAAAQSEPQPVAMMDDMVKWYIDADKAERAALDAMPKAFAPGEGVVMPLPD